MTTTLASLQDQVDALTAQLTSLTSGGGILPADVTPNADGTITLNVRLRFLNPFDINTTGVGTITVLPDESLAAFLPMLGRGDTGPSPKLSNVVLVNEIGPDAPLPTTPHKFDVIDPGNPAGGVGPTYQLTLTLRKGSKGDPGTPINLEALANVRYTGTQTTPLPGQTVVYRTPEGSAAGWYVEAVRSTDFAVCNSFTPASGNAPNQKQGSLTLQAQSYARRPWVGGAVQINPAADTTNGITHIDLIARLGDVDNGVIVGYGQGLDTNQPFIANLWPTPAAVGGSAIIPPGQTGIIHLIAVQTNSTLSNWGTTVTHASFNALGLAI